VDLEAADDFPRARVALKTIVRHCAHSLSFNPKL
jgi:hypothetical protein